MCHAYINNPERSNTNLHYRRGGYQPPEPRTLQCIRPMESTYRYMNKLLENLFFLCDLVKLIYLMI